MRLDDRTPIIKYVTFKNIKKGGTFLFMENKMLRVGCNAAQMSDGSLHCIGNEEMVGVEHV